MAKVKRKLLEELVVEEAYNLKMQAKTSELENLDFDSLDPMNTERCIYGQMTGDCHSKRAYKLIRKSCPMVIDSRNEGISGDIIDIDDLSNALDNDIKKFDVNFRYKFFSPIEIFIMRKRNRKNGNNAKLIAYLRGESDELIFN